MENLQKRMDNLLKELSSIIENIKAENLQNEQSTLDFLDKVNEFSVMF